ncbi:hypothetical protein Hdeb2414_s0026g00681991 [Helianthus debilis subsp. tardiflorus]
MKLDLRLFRLPEDTVSELATTKFSHRELVVTVPRDVDLERSEEVWIEGNGPARFIFVQ